MSAERLRDALQQSLIRLSNRLGELSAWRDRETLYFLQDEHSVLVKAQGEETLHFRAEVVPHGLFGTPTRRPQVELACMLVPDADLRPLYEDLATALEAARYHLSSGRRSIAEHLVGALHRALTRILLPRDDTPEYLARIAAVSQGRALEN